jgi:hypothetical protein
MTASRLHTASLGVTVSVNTTIGAPGPTAVFTTAHLPHAGACERLLRAAYPELRRQIAFDKALFVAPGPGPGGRFRSRFLQITAPSATMIQVAAGHRDCVNSTTAAYPALTGTGGTVAIANADTGLVVTVGPGRRTGTVHVDVQPATPVRPEHVRIATPGCPAVLATAVNNPYVLLDAAAAGLDAQDLLRLSGPADPGLLRPLGTAVEQVRTQLRLPVGGELPKLAILASAGPDTVAARTVYLGHWHPGLPLTGAITFLTAALIPRSPWFNRDVVFTGLRLRTPAGDVRVTAQAGPDGALTSFHIPDREVTRDIAPHPL